MQLRLSFPHYLTNALGDLKLSDAQCTQVFGPLFAHSLCVRGVRSLGLGSKLAAHEKPAIRASFLCREQKSTIDNG